MPNWKTYESSVRLLSAIIAAHPDLKLNYGAMAQLLDDGTTEHALQHRFRPLKQDALAMKAAIASNYGEGASENGGTPTKAKKPRAKATPRKKKEVKSENSDEDGEGGSDVEMETPSKKGSMHKVQSGRVTKQARTPRKTAPTNLAEAVTDEEDEAEGMIKNEDHGDSQHYSHNGGSFNNGHGYGNGHRNGNGNGYTAGYGDSFENADDNDMYYAAEDGYGGEDDDVV